MTRTRATRPERAVAVARVQAPGGRARRDIGDEWGAW
jgi:hypothetical protein